MTGAGNNTWLLDGSEPALIDAGVGVPAHIDAIAQALGGRDLARVLVTHSHNDHCAGIPALRARWPRIEVCVSEHWAGDVAPLGASHRAAATVGSSLPAEALAKAGRALRDGDQVRTGLPAPAEASANAIDRTLTVLYTPGHAIDHVCFWDADRRELYSGDMLVRGSTVMIPATRGGGLRAYLASLERLKSFGPLRVFPGHGPIINDPIELIDNYLEHRRMRDGQVAACLADGITDPDAIVSRIYPDLAPGLRPAARATVEAHLQKIADEK